MTINLNNRLISTLSFVFFAFVMISSVADIISDLSQGAKISHLVQEGIIVIFSLILLFVLFQNTLKAKKKNKELLQIIAEVSAQSAKASRELVAAKKIFGEEIVAQFSSWELTESESDIALLILKGFNSKEISNFRKVSEKTVRNQLTSIYRKSGLNGKHAFISWFIDGLI